MRRTISYFTLNIASFLFQWWNLGESTIFRSNFNPFHVLLFDYGHIFPRQKCWFGEKSAFLTQKTWFHAISRLFSFPTIFICKKWAKYNFTATAKFRRKRFGYSNTPKHAQNWLFLGIFSFFLFLRSLFWELWTPNLLFHSSNVGLKILKNWSMPLIYIKPNFQIWPKTKLSSLQWFEFLWQIPFVNIAIIPPFKARWGGWQGGSFDINTLFSYVAQEKIDPTIDWVSSLNLYGVVHILCNCG